MSSENPQRGGGLAGRPSLLQRAVVSAALGAWFLVAYCGAQAITARRARVPSFHFGWERHVPFVPLLIVPYLSIDLFFVTAPLLCRTGRELRVLATRVAAAVGVAAVCFVAVPLRFAFDRPATTGPLGWVFRQFYRADQPFNQLPSLHVALLLIVGTPFVRATRGWGRAAVLVWFGLIAASPLLVYQHHAADLLAGLGLGLLCLTLIGDDPWLSFDGNRRVGAYYGVGGVVLVIVCVLLGRGGWWLWWPTVSVLTVAVAYAAAGPGVYGKREGRVSLASRVLLWPTLAGQQLSRRWYARRGRAWDAVTDQLWIGRQLTRPEAAAAVAAGVGAVIDLTCEFTEPAELRSVPYLHLPTLDLTAPTAAAVDAAVAFAVEQMAAGRVVYVHCKAGYSRTAVVAGAVLLATGRAASADDAIGQLRRARPGLIVRPEARRALAGLPSRRAEELNREEAKARRADEGELATDARR